MSNPLTNCCQALYTYPISREKLLIIGGGVLAAFIVGGLLILIVSGGEDSDNVKGSDSLKHVPLIVSRNSFSVHLKEIANNVISSLDFKNISNNSGEGWKKCSNCQTDLERLAKGLVNGQVWTITANCNSSYKDAVSLILEQIDAIKRLLAKYPSDIKLVTDSEGMIKSFENGVKSSLIAVEGSHTFDSRLAVLRIFYDLGVRSLSLVADDCSPPWYKKDTIDDFGWVVVKEMNRMGMIIDIARLSKEAQLAVLEKSEAPVIISNANSFAKCASVGNVEDEVLKKLKEKGGLILISFDPVLVVGKEMASAAKMKDLIPHITYIRSIVGVDGMGIAAGFDGFDKSIQGLEDTSKYPDLFDALYKTNSNHTAWSIKELEGLAGKNFLKIFHAVEQKAMELQTSVPISETYEDIKDFPAKLDCYTDWRKKA